MICMICKGLGYLYSPLTKKYDVQCWSCKGKGEL